MIAQVFDSPANIGFFLGLTIGTLYLINQLFVITSGSSLLKKTQKWFKSRPILLPTFLFLFLPFICSVTFESIFGFHTLKEFGESKPTLPGKFINSIIGPIVGGFIGFISSYLTWRRSLEHENRNVAYAIYQELVVIDRRLKTILDQIDNNPPSLIVPVNPPISEEIYTQEGLFFIFRKESSQFKKELSNSIFEFYMNLNEAEKFRRQMEDEAQVIKISKEIDKSMEIEEIRQTIRQRGSIQKLNERDSLFRNPSKTLKNEEKEKVIICFLYSRMSHHLDVAYDTLPRLKALLKEEFN